MHDLEDAVSDMHSLGRWGKAGPFPQRMHLTTGTAIRVQEESLREDVGMIKVFGNELFLAALEVTLLHLPNSYNARSTLLELIHFSIHHSRVFFFLLLIKGFQFLIA